jgi:hypothetical protein
VKTIVSVVLFLILACAVSAAQCPLGCQSQITTLMDQVKALQNQLATLPVSHEFDLTPTVVNNQYIATKPLDAKLLFVNVSLDQQTITLLPTVIFPSTPVNLEKSCNGVAVHFQVSLVQNTIMVWEYGGVCPQITLHFLALARP